MLPHRDTESGETLPVAEKVSRFRGSGTIDGTGQVASIVMPRRCRRALNAPLGRFFALLMPCSNLWIQKRTPPCWVVFFLQRTVKIDIFGFGVKGSTAYKIEPSYWMPASCAGLIFSSGKSFRHHTLSLSIKYETTSTYCFKRDLRNMRFPAR